MAEGVEGEVGYGRRAAQRRQTVHVLDRAQDIVVVERRGICAGDDQVRIAVDDRGDRTGRMGIGLLLVSGDDQEAVVRLGPLQVAVEFCLQPGVGTGSEKVVLVRIGGVGRLLVGAMGIVEVIRNDERDGGQARVAGSGGWKRGKGSIHGRGGNGRRPVRPDVGELRHWIVVAHVEIGRRRGVCRITCEPGGHVAVVRKRLGITDEAEIIAR